MANCFWHLSITGFQNLSLRDCRREGTQDNQSEKTELGSFKICLLWASITYISCLCFFFVVHIYTTELERSIYWSRLETCYGRRVRTLDKNNMWELVSLHAGKRTVVCKKVFAVKQKADETIERYKARLVAKGFTQTYGVDYQEAFPPVAKMNSILTLLSCATNLGWCL